MSKEKTITIEGSIPNAIAQFLKKATIQQRLFIYVLLKRLVEE